MNNERPAAPPVLAGPALFSCAQLGFECPIDGCDEDDFSTLDGWSEHMNEQHGVEGPL